MEGIPASMCARPLFPGRGATETVPSAQIHGEHGMSEFFRPAAPGSAGSPGMWLRFVAASPVFFFFVVSALLYPAGFESLHGSPSLLFRLDFLFLTLFPAISACLAARGYLASGSSSILFLGCGLLTIGYSNVFAAWAARGPEGVNHLLALRDSGCLLAAVFHLGGALCAFRKSSQPRPAGGRLLGNLGLAYGGVVLAVSLLAFLTAYDLPPRFFTRGQEPTLLRQLVLGLTVSLFLLSALALSYLYYGTRSEFPFWYSLALILIAQGIGVITFQKAVGTPMGWTGRTFQYLGGVYLFVSALVAARDSLRRGSPLGGTVSGLVLPAELDRAWEAQRESEKRYRALFNNMANGFSVQEIVTDGSGNPVDCVVLETNDAFERLTGLKKADLVGRRVTEAVPGVAEDPADWIRVFGEVALTGKAIRFENYSEALRRWYSIWAYSPKKGQVATVFEEITERKRVEEAVARSESLLRAITDTSPDPIFIKDRESRMLLANPATLRVLGKTAEEVIGRRDVEFYSDPQIAGAIMENDRRVMETGRSGIFEETVPSAQGERVFMSAKTPCRDGKGTIVGIVGIARDITDLRRTERERETTVRLLRLINQSTGTDDLVRAVADFFQQQSGCEAVGIRLKEGDDYPYRESRGFSAEFVLLENRLCAFDAGGDAVRDGVDDPVLACMCGNVIQGRFDPSKPFFTPGGSFWTNSTTELLASASEADRQGRTRDRCNGEGYESVALIPLRVGPERLGLLQLNDRRQGMFSAGTIELWERLADQLAIALSKCRTEEALRRNERLYRAIGESIDYGVWVCDPDGGNVYASESFLNLVGLTPEQWPDFDWSKLLHPHEAGDTVAAWKACVRSGDSWDREHRFRGVDGKWHDVLGRGVPVKDESGKIVCWTGINLDISGLKRAEQALRASELRWRQLAEAMPHLVWTCTPEGSCDFLSRQWLEYTGIGEARQYGYGWLQQVHRADRESIFVAWRRAVRSGDLFDVECRIRRHDGAYRWFKTRAVAVRDESGRVVKWYGSSTDIHELREMQAALRDSEERYRLFFQNSMDGIVATLHDEGRIMAVNSEACRIFGYTAEEFRGLAEDAMLDGADPRLAVMIGERERTGTWNGQLTYRKKGGAKFPAEISSALFRDSEGCRIGIVILRDITERKRMETELLAARDELERKVRERTRELVEANRALVGQAALLDLAHDAILVRDIENRIIFWNKGAEKTYGHAREQALGKTTGELLHTSAPVPPEQIIEQVLREGWWEGEMEHRTASGDTITVESRWALQTGQDGGPSGFLEINRDVTLRKQAEEDLKANLRRLELVNAELQEFAFVASHDLQEPLRKIQAFGDRLKRKCGHKLDEVESDYLARMENAAGRMQQLIRELLSYSRVSTKREPFQLVELKQVVEEVVQIFEHRFRDYRARIEIGELPAVDADATQMKQLFQNLIGNALKFQKAGAKPLVRVYGRPHGEHARRIFVEDNGIGFDEKYVDRIFAPFQRLHGRMEYEGTGMGLAICRKIVERHQGSITARSRPGEGSTFIVTLPLSRG